MSWNLAHQWTLHSPRYPITFAQGFFHGNFQRWRSLMRAARHTADAGGAETIQIIEVKGSNVIHKFPPFFLSFQGQLHSTELEAGFDPLQGGFQWTSSQNCLSFYPARMRLYASSRRSSENHNEKKTFEMFSWSLLNILHHLHLRFIYAPMADFIACDPALVELSVLLWQPARPSMKSHVIPEMIGSQKIHWKSQNISSLWVPLCLFLWLHFPWLGKVQVKYGRFALATCLVAAGARKQAWHRRHFLPYSNGLPMHAWPGWIESSNLAISGLFSSWRQRFPLEIEKTSGILGCFWWESRFKTSCPVGNQRDSKCSKSGVRQFCAN